MQFLDRVSALKKLGKVVRKAFGNKATSVIHFADGRHWRGKSGRFLERGIQVREKILRGFFVSTRFEHMREFS